MLLRFWCGLVAVVVAWAFGRWKWRRVAARREEIRRLMSLASEETARAELEAASGYVSYGAGPGPEEAVIVLPGSSPGPRQVQYQCEVCFSPTTTRCKQCKSVRYCSRKCQVLHWRQGHKDDCRAVTAHHNNDSGVRSHLKEFNQEKIQSSQNGIQEMHNTEPIESSFEERLLSNPILHVLDEENDAETETSDNREKSDTNIKAPVALDSNMKDGNGYDELSVSMNVESIRPTLSERPSLTNPELGPTAQLKPGCSDTEKTFEYSSSSSCSAANSEEHSLSEPSTPSDFWAGKLELKKSNITALKFNDVIMSGRINVHVEKLVSEMSRVLRDDSCQDTSMPRKSIALSEVSEDGLTSQEPLFSGCKLPGQKGVSHTSTEYSSKEVSKLSEGHVQSKHGVDVTSVRSLPKVVDHEFEGTNGFSDTLRESQRNDSSRHRSSEAHVSSSPSTEKTAILDALLVENERNRENTSCSLKSSSYVRVEKSGTKRSPSRAKEELRASNLIRHGSLGSGSGIMGRYEGSFPYEHFVKLYNWNKVELRPCGLKNCGNSCYANSVLQCLAFTPPLTAYFLQGLHAKSCRKKEWCFTCEFEVLVMKAKEGNYPLSPSRIMSQMQRVASHLGNGREEDAHEFLRYAIDAMQLVCLEEAGVNVPSSMDEDTTLMGLTFGGYLQSKIECMRCGGISKQHERIMDLAIEIGGEIVSLEDALRQFTRSEILDGENKYRCGRCKSYEKAKKKLRVLEAPNVLTIALKRFQSGEYGKLNKSVKFPEILNLAQYMRGTSDKSPIYQLYGALVHLDVKNATFTGHYVCYIKNNQGRWFKADDSLVQAVELEKVLSNDTYMLFYARCSPRAPKQIRSSMIPNDPHRIPKNPVPKFKFLHPTEPPWETSPPELNDQTSIRSNSEESLTDYSSMFSETGSNSTESSNRGSTSTEDSMFDHPTLGDVASCWNRTTSDSDTTSPSLSLSPVRTRVSPLADLDRYSSDAETSSASSVNVSSKNDGDGFWARGSGGKVVLKSNEFSCRDIKLNKLGTDQSCDNVVRGVYVRKSMS